MNILAELRARFEKALHPFVKTPEELREFAAMIRPSQQDRFGDFQANFAMPLAKALAEDPRTARGEGCRIGRARRPLQYSRSGWARLYQSHAP
jgi:arginyl-tRNA synthetase